MSVLQGAVYPAELVAAADLTGSTVTATFTAPDGTVTSVPASGITVDGRTATLPITATQVGTYAVLWTVAGAVAGVMSDQFTVIAPSVDLISLSDLRDELNIRDADAVKDAKLRRWLRSATSLIENVTGPIRAHPQTDVFDGGTASLVLSSRWVSSITSVVETRGTAGVTVPEQAWGTYPTASGYLWDRETNILRRVGSGGGWAAGRGNVTVAYIAGLATIPDDIQLATAELIRHWYRKNEVPSRGSGFSAAPSDDAGMDRVGQYMLPNAVMELLERWQRPHGFA